MTRPNQHSRAALAALRYLAILTGLAAASGALSAQAPGTLAFEAERLPYRVGPNLFELVAGANGKLHFKYAETGGAGPLLILDTGDPLAEAKPLAVDGRPIIVRRFGWRADSLWVTDRESSRLTLFDHEGHRIEERPIAPVNLDPPIRPGEIRAVLPNDEFILTTTAGILALWPRELPAGAYPIAQLRNHSASGAIRALPVLRRTSAGAVIDTTAWLERRNYAMVMLARELVPGRSASVMGIQPFADHALMGVHPAGSWLAVVDRSVSGSTPAHYSVHVIAANGDTIRTGQYSYTPIKLEREDLEAEWVRQGLSLTADTTEALEIARGELYAPATYPPATNVLVGPDGWIWICREAIQDAARVSWDLIDQAGRRVGSVSVPSHLRIRAIRGREAWATEHAETGDPHLWHLVVSIPM